MSKCLFSLFNFSFVQWYCMGICDNWNKSVHQKSPDFFQLNFFGKSVNLKFRKCFANMLHLNQTNQSFFMCIFLLAAMLPSWVKSCIILFAAMSIALAQNIVFLCFPVYVFDLRECWNIVENQKWVLFKTHNNFYVHLKDVFYIFWISNCNQLGVLSVRYDNVSKPIQQHAIQTGLRILEVCQSSLFASFPKIHPLCVRRWMDVWFVGLRPFQQ